MKKILRFKGPHVAENTPCDSFSILISKNFSFDFISTPLHFASKTSDKFSKCSSSFKKEITIIQADIRFSAKVNARKILCAVEIPLLQQRNGTE